MKNQNETNVTFGQFFRERRIQLKFTLRSFCERFGYDPGNISRLERNILSPSIDEDKLEGFATALQIKKGSTDWVNFFDLAHIAKGLIPDDILNSPQIMSILPAFYRTVRGEKLNKEKINELIALLVNENCHKGK